MRIKQLDHIVLTVSDFRKSVEFYTGILGMRSEGNSLFFGNQKINLHRFAGEFQPSAKRPAAGGADFCLLCIGSIAEIEAELRAGNVEIEIGPVARNGAQGLMDSLYLRDPDGNLVELSVLRD